ncbi:hypothetical protein JXA88_06400 [Candidatus Fermentibacteria bacterium]|nr:hypothetical protein [Candidatus Fermentibacteria bacterium]
MSQFIYRIKPTRIGMLVEGPTDRETQVLGQHFAYLEKLTASGQVLVAGRTPTVDEGTFGIVVFEAESETEAERLMANDPAVLHGVMRAELWPFHVALWSARGPQVEADGA